MLVKMAYKLYCLLSGWICCVAIYA